MTYIYFLQCRGGKYYIGKTENPAFRLENHFSGGGSAWTKKYPPTKVKKIIPDCDDFDEDKYTLKYMSKYGIDNVRGGSYCKVKLDASTTKHIERSIVSTADACYKCGEVGHFASRCNNVPIKRIGKSKPKPKFKSKAKPIVCERCGREGHLVDRCYAKFDVNGTGIEEGTSSEEGSSEKGSSDEEIEVWGCQYCGKEFDSYKGCSFHEKVHCKHKPTKKTNYKQTYNKNPYSRKSFVESVCKRCGREGHAKNNCYAERHVKGYDLYY